MDIIIKDLYIHTFDFLNNHDSLTPKNSCICITRKKTFTIGKSNTIFPEAIICK